MFQMDLKECFSRVRDGDKEAFAHIYDELKQPVFTIACRIVQSREVAEDITHDVFMKLFISPLDSTIKNPRAWVFQMARNLSIDALRKKQCSDIEDVLMTAKDDFEEIMMRFDIETAISKLSCKEREILTLHLNAGLRFHEISRIVELSMPTTYRLYRKALINMQTLLKGGAL